MLTIIGHYLFISPMEFILTINSGWSWQMLLVFFKYSLLWTRLIQKSANSQWSMKSFILLWTLAYLVFSGFITPREVWILLFLPEAFHSIKRTALAVAKGFFRGWGEGREGIGREDWFSKNIGAMLNFCAQNEFKW